MTARETSQSPTLRTAIYARVSTREQEPRTQILSLERYARHRGFKVVRRLVEQESGAKPDRPELMKLMTLVRQRKVDVVLVWKFDRFARSTKQLVDALEEFRALGIDFVSYTENIDTSTPAGKALFTMVSAFAEFERDLLRERVVAGMDRARADGIHLGRPPLDPALIKEMRRLRAKKNLSIRNIAHRVARSHAVVVKYTSAKRKAKRRQRSQPRA